MYPIKYMTRVVYTSMFGEEGHKDFKIFASSKLEAVAIAREIFSVLNGENIIRVGCKPMELDDSNRAKILKGLDDVVDSLYRKIYKKTYPDMLEFLTSMEGFDVETVNDNIKSFKVKLLNYVVKIEIRGGYTEVNTSEVYFCNDTVGAFVIKDNTVYFSR